MENAPIPPHTANPHADGIFGRDNLFELAAVMARHAAMSPAKPFGRNASTDQFSPGSSVHAILPAQSRATVEWPTACFCAITRRLLPAARSARIAFTLAASSVTV